MNPALEAHGSRSLDFPEVPAPLAPAPNGLAAESDIRLGRHPGKDNAKQLKGTGAFCCRAACRNFALNEVAPIPPRWRYWHVAANFGCLLSGRYRGLTDLARTAGNRRG